MIIKIFCRLDKLLLVAMVIKCLPFVISQGNDFRRIKNSTCDTEAQCAVYKNAECFQFNTYCICNNGFGPIYNKHQTTCEKLVKNFNDTCEFQEQCQLFGKDSICNAGRCICRDGSYFETRNDYCYYGNVSTYSCKSDLDCGSEVCAADFCKCMNLDHILRKINGKFVCGAISQTDCVFNEQCQYSVMGMDSECKMGNCSCIDKYTLNGTNVCVKKLEEQCQNDNECIYKTCNGGTCKCPLNTIFGKEELDCFDARKLSLNDNCTINEQCSRFINDSHCNALCRCNPNFLETNGSCVKVSDALDASCTIEEQCTTHLQNTKCINGFCKCKSGYHETNQECFESSTYRTQCRVTENCVLFNGICEKNICECDQNKIFDSESNNCLERSNLLTIIIIIIIVILIIIIIIGFAIIVIRNKKCTKYYEIYVRKGRSGEDSAM